VLQDLFARHLDIEPDVQLDDRIGNWVKHRVDVGFRAGSPPADGFIARRLLPLLTEPVCDHLGLYLYCSGRVAQPARVRAFIGLVAARSGLTGNKRRVSRWCTVTHASTFVTHPCHLLEAT
jgi:hypothetical protein